MLNEEENLWDKIWKSFVAFGVFWAWFAATGNNLSISWIIFIAIALVFFVVYWHILNKFFRGAKSVENYFKELKEDIKYIKNHVNHRRKK